MKRSLRMFALLLALVMLLCSCGARQTENELSSQISSLLRRIPTEAIEEWKQNGRFEDLTYQVPDAALVEEPLALCIDLLQQKASADEILAAMDTMDKAYCWLNTQYSLCYIQYYLDLTNEQYSTDLAEFIEIESKFNNALSLFLRDLFAAGYREAFEAHYGKDVLYYADSVVELFAQDITEYQLAEQELIRESERISNELYVEHDGQAYTVYTLGDAYMQDKITYEEYLQLYDAYQEEANRQLGEIFLEMIRVRDELAETAGYSDYTSYAYTFYTRDFTAEDAQRFCDAVKESIVPLHNTLYASGYTEEAMELYNTVYDQEETLQSLQQIFRDMDPRLGEIFEEMLERGMCDIDPADNKYSGAFATDLRSYDMPFLFINWDGSYNSIFSIVHEFGHYSNMHLAAPNRLLDVASLDLAEVDSQGLELLVQSYFDELFGSLANAARSEVILSFLNSLITGCMEDEFQRIVYQNPDMTLPQINAVYEQLVAEYGMDKTFGREGTDWVFIDHTFSSPLYYISYATSLIPALTIWMESETDPEAAIEHYLQFSTERGYTTYCAALEAFGMPSPFEPETIADIADSIEQYADTLVS